MKFGKTYWVIVLLIGLCLFGLGIMKYGNGISFTGLFIESAVDKQGIGNSSASKVIELYCDYQNYYCQKANELAVKIANENNDVFFVIKQYPIGNKPFDYKAAIAATCAQNQGFLMQVNSLLLENHYDLTEEKIATLSRSVSGLDLAVFDECYSTEATQKQVFADIVDAQNAGVNSTPGFVFGSKNVSGTNMDVIEEEILSWIS